MNSVDESIRKVSYYPSRLHQDRRIFLEMRTLCLMSIALIQMVLFYLVSYLCSFRLAFFFLFFTLITFIVSSFNSILFNFKTERLSEYYFWAFLAYYICHYFFRKYAILQFLEINYTSSSEILFTQKGLELPQAFSITLDEFKSTHLLYYIHPFYFLQLLHSSGLKIKRIIDIKDLLKRSFFSRFGEYWRSLGASLTKVHTGSTPSSLYRWTGNIFTCLC